jgi:hypothetical protein
MSQCTDDMAEEPFDHGIKMVDLTGQLTDQRDIARRAWQLMEAARLSSPLGPCLCFGHRSNWPKVR